MDPVEINAGNWYLRALRADERMDDRYALARLTEPEHGPDYVARADADWRSDVRYSWAVCEPTTGEMLAEVALIPSSGVVSTRARPGHDDAARAAEAAVRRFAAVIEGAP
ncbi:hypothetical protein [Mycolicibacterium brumae]|uniref:Uncharacterized protein n=1 Tax=Mycolicibacterium brumae TaxID=85968 RepID=A0A2G5PAZ9_9MYCO|nr:hypothetical protein [Mycolicibacterium brumae]MCV7193255.1 hypothetical protein [Mycolicibacterium brumae]PIB75538.1 hypothetical protein CQY22_008940 [Mycolicibacterium brumae]RWA16691.1 hypothetical protein MBRU_08170 [Mycolicibacterium brumae DSM 44177]UWW09910.1 hypothetical protein L2Z93_003027 [Mycolicibacterium brumae]